MVENGEHLTRLEKLITLLEAKNPIVRQQAVEQLGNVCDSDSRSLGALLDKLRTYLFSTNWDTRVACARAIREICQNLKIHPVEKFSLETLLNCGTFLLSSDGSEFDIAVVDKEKQWKLINKELGLSSNMGLTCRDLVSDGDLEVQYNEDQTTGSGDDDEASSKSAVSGTKRCRFFSEELEFEVASVDGSDETRRDVETLQRFLLQLCRELYDPKWTKRHGVVLGIKECVTCALCSKKTFLKNDMFLLKHLFCMLALDRFHDFVGNHVVAPIRETAAQVICILNNVSPVTIQLFVRSVVLQFLSSPCWECRHDALLIVKYIFASDHARSVYSEQLLQAVMSCLNDGNDDIVISAADALSPVVEPFINSMPSLAEFLTSKCWQMLPKFLSNTVDVSAKGLLQILLHSNLETVDCKLLITLFRLIDHDIAEIRHLFLKLILKVVSSGVLPSPLSDAFLVALMPALFTRNMVETEPDICRDIDALWTILVDCSDQLILVKFICPMLGYWVSCLMVSEKNPVLNKDYFRLPVEIYLGSDVILSFSERQRTVIVNRVRLRSAKLLASLMKIVLRCRLPLEPDSTESPAQSLVSLLVFHLSSRSVNQLIVICMLLCELAKMSVESDANSDDQLLAVDGMDTIKQRLVSFLMDVGAVYEETLLCMSEVNSLCSEFSRFCGETFRNACPGHLKLSPRSFVNPDEAKKYCTDLINEMNDGGRLSVDETRRLRDRYKAVVQKLNVISEDIVRIQLWLRVWLCCATIRLHHLPNTFNPVVRPIMELIKSDSCDDVLLPQVASCLCLFLEFVSTSSPCPNPKIIKNLMSSHGQYVTDTVHGEQSCQWSCVMFLASNGHHVAPNVDDSDATSPLPTVSSNTTHTLETVLPDLHCTLRQGITRPHLKTLCSLLETNDCRVRHLSARCVAAFAAADLTSTVNIVLPPCLTRLTTCVDELFPRLGIVEMIACLVTRIDIGLKGLIHILASAVFSLMTDSVPSLRNCASHCFRHLIRIMPLDSCDGTIDGLCTELEVLRTERVEFFHLLTCPSKLPPVHIPSTSVDLRPYQKEGVKWLSFLIKYNLHGILCDDMGLGKTLQALCIMATAHAHIASSRVTTDALRHPVKSLVLCPRTLTSHWANEVRKFFCQGKVLVASVIENTDALVNGWFHSNF
ncbi:unnamed protein product [Soboliphyme baturini]|uniref:TATA-binding protein-associated factor n=1 Tax=Soboliphyme baturini TaxID=241478 RepID=A0A183IKP7_9BILA|nr:unnamed protein product [Soboliphyme baturini]